MDCEIEPDFLHEATLAQFRRQRLAAGEPGGADHMHAHLARCVAAEHAPVLAKNYPHSEPRRRQRTADTRDAASGHQQVTRQLLGFTHDLRAVPQVRPAKAVVLRGSSKLTPTNTKAVMIQPGTPTQTKLIRSAAGTA